MENSHIMHVDFVSSKHTEETCTICVWSGNEDIVCGNETDNFIEELFKSLLDNYQKRSK